MENSRPTIQVQEISYPVFILPSTTAPTLDGLVTYVYEESSENDVITKSIKLIDDKSIESPKLSVRRLYLANKGVPLVKLSKGIFFLGDLLKLAKSKRLFIDSHGRIFNYQKQTRAVLTFRKIKRLIPIKSGGAILEIDGVPTRLKCMYNPKAEETWAGVLRWRMGYILYGLFTQQYKDSWRLV